MANDTTVRSLAFQRCIGVFEGGGVRGAAFAGAYSAAHAAGIEFVGTTGASAGSIAAAFIAASIKPEQLKTELSFRFRELLTKPNPPQALTKRLKQGTLSAFGQKAATGAAWYYSLGSHSSEAIELWVDDTLKRVLDKRETVFFEDIPKPLAIVAADLKSRKPKIFSKRTTPTTSVGFAVRASCSIPFFFQPVPGEGTLLVDGGLVANLPIFLVDELELKEKLPILCFRLVGERKSPGNDLLDGFTFAEEVIETAINGVSEINLSFGWIRQVIDIDTGTIKSTEFDLDSDSVKTLIKNGEDAVTKFVETEQVKVSESPNRSSDRTVRGYREGLLDRTAATISNSTGQVIIVAGDLSWLRDLHVSLLKTVLSGRDLKIFCERANTQESKVLLQAAKALGAEVVELTKPIGIRGVIVSSGDSTTKMFLVEKLPQRHGSIYVTPADQQLIDFVLARLDETGRSGKSHGRKGPPKLSPIADSEIVHALSTYVPQYTNKIIIITDTPVAALRPLSKYLEEFKLRRTEETEVLLLKLGINGAARYDGSPWIMGLPVIEQLRNGDRIIIDGTHRVFRALRSMRLQTLRIALVENDESNLPAKPFPNWDHIQIRRDVIDREDRYVNYNEENFRPIREAYNRLAR